MVFAFFKQRLCHTIFIVKEFSFDISLYPHTEQKPHMVTFDYSAILSCPANFEDKFRKNFNPLRNLSTKLQYLSLQISITPPYCLVQI